MRLPLLRVPASTARLCRVFARACGAAVVLDTYAYRPGLSTVHRWRRDPGPLAFAVLSPVASEACYRACLRGYAVAHGVGVTVTAVWERAVGETLSLGNAGMGSTLLLVFQAAGLGYALARGSDAVHHVMGAVTTLVDREGVEGAKAFYRVLGAVAPSYLARLSSHGLPDASATGLAVDQVESSRTSLRRVLEVAALYDPVSRDLVTGMSVSLGYAYGEACRGDPVKALERATYAVAAWLDDMLVRRKLGRSLRALWERAYRGDEAAVRELERLLVDVGPGSAADVAVNAAARCLYERLKG